MPAQTIIRVRQDTAANWTSANSVLAAGEFGYETDTEKIKVGNGATAWNSLTYISKLDSSGKIPTSALPDISITDTFVVASEAAMLALTAQTGDVAIRTDVDKTFILKTSPATALANWQELLTTGNNQPLTLGSGLSGTSYNGSAAVTAAVDSTIPRLTASQTFTGTQTLIPSATTAQPLIAKGAASQTADLIQTQNSGGTAVASVTANGSLILNPGTTTAATSNLLGFSGTADQQATQLGVIAATATTVGAVIRGAASQTANLTQWQNSAGSTLAFMSSSGYLTLSGGAILSNSGGSFERAFGGAFIGMIKTTSTVTSPAANSSRIYFKDGTTSGTLKLCVRAGTSGEEQTLFDNIPQTSGTTGASVISRDAQFNATAFALGGGSGVIGIANAATVPSTNPAGGGVLYSSSGGLNWIGTSGSAQTIVNGDGTSPFAKLTASQTFTGTQTIRPAAANANAIILRGEAAQTANLQEWQNSSGTSLAEFSANGALVLRPVNFAANQSAGIQLRDNSNSWAAGGMYLRSDSGGIPRIGFVAVDAAIEVLTLRGSHVGINTTGPNTLGGGGVATQLGVVAVTASTVGAVIRGAASQTANLQEWQNSAGTVLANIQAGGNGRFNNFGTTASTMLFGTENSGANVSLVRQTAAPASPGANTGKITFRNGTTSGTLKLVAIAGASGEEQTLFDNIPQTSGTTSATIDGGSA
nr:MAG TPA: hyaluronidase [Caudoviricetes sp.]